jgi:hypothetical protein
VGRRSILQTLLSLENPEAVESSSGAILQKKSTTPTADSLQSP